MILDRLAHRAENDPGLLQLLLVGGSHRHAVQHGVHRHSGQPRLLFQRDAQLAERFQHLRVHFVQALRPVVRRLGRRVVVNVLVVDGRKLHVRPRRFRVGLPRPEPVRLQAPLQHPLRLVLLGRNQAHHVLAEALGKRLLLNVDGETPLVVGVQLFGSGIPGNDALCLGRHRTCILPTGVVSGTAGDGFS